MKQFAALFAALDKSTRTQDKVAALADYFHSAAAADACWAVHFLTGNRPPQAVPARRLHAIAAEAAGLPPWLFAESYDAVGDLAETIALILPPPRFPAELPLHHWITERLAPLRKLDEVVQKDALLACWDALDAPQRFVFNKLITGGFRVGVSSQLVIRALAGVAGIDAKVIAHRLAGAWRPSPENYRELLSPATGKIGISQPYPFYLAHPLTATPAQFASELGARGDWQAEWKWDGIRGQLLKRHGQAFLWSRGDELVSAQFPELVAAAMPLADCVLDGEILAQKDGRVMPFTALQKRLGRKQPGKKILAETPVVFIAYDLLEVDGEDWRLRPLHERRGRLHELVYGIPGNTVLQLSDIVRAPSWATLALAREEARQRGTEGLMLKRRDSAYGVGRATGKGGADWWKWKLAPMTVDAVLVAAQRGHGKRAGLYSDYTFAIWKQVGEQRQLVPFAKAYSGLGNDEIATVDAFIRKNTLEKFGPVRTVSPALVFELGFEGIQRSARHKSGIAVRFPRILRMRADKQADDADSLDSILPLLVRND
jgi:DNA ligase-1